MVDVYLSPSTQEFNIGYGSYGTEENRMNQVADVVQYELERHGVSVERNSPSMSLREAVEQSNAVNPRLHVALHSNAGDGLSRGAEVYTHRFGGTGEELADNLYEELQMISPTEGLGVKESAPLFGGQGFYEMRYTRAPAALVEVAFHDNPADAQYIISNIYQIGSALAKGILDTVEIPYQQDTAENVTFLKNKYNNV